MKKIQKERKSCYDVFVAVDGTEFLTEEECKKYEESAYGVLMARYKKLIVKSGTEYDLVPSGSEDNSCEVVKVETQADADTVLQLYLLINPHIAKAESDFCMNWRERAEKLCSRALAENDYLIMCHGYEYNDNFWFIGTRNSVKEGIDAFCSVEKNE